MTGLLTVSGLTRLLAAATVTALGASAAARPVRATLGTPFTLKPSQLAEVARERLRLEFRAVLEDSRCPRGARCIREGEGVVAVVVTTASGAREERRLQTSPAEATETVVEGYRIALRGLDPYPTVDTPVQPAAYRATFLISR